MQELKPLRDIIAGNLRILFVGTSPGPKSSRAEHYFAGGPNVFWRLLFESGLTPRRLTAQQDNEMIEYGYGLTDIVKKPTGIDRIRRLDTLSGADKLNRRMAKFRPRVAAFVGKKGWQIYNRTPRKQYGYGYQRTFKNTHLYLIPSSSGQSYRDTKYPEKLRWYKALHEYACGLGTPNSAPDQP